MSLVLLLFVLASMASWIAAGMFLSVGNRRRTARVLAGWGASAAMYTAALLAAAAAPQDSTLRIGKFYCDDDWCMSVQQVDRTPAGTDIAWRLDLRLFSDAHHGPRSAQGASVYLTDGRRRFYPRHDAGAQAFFGRIAPQQTVPASLTFDVPANAGPLYFAGEMEHLQYASFIIGSGDLLGRPRLRLRLP